MHKKRLKIRAQYEYCSFDSFIYLFLLELKLLGNCPDFLSNFSYESRTGTFCVRYVLSGFIYMYFFGKHCPLSIVASIIMLTSLYGKVRDVKPQVARNGCNFASLF